MPNANKGIAQRNLIQKNLLKILFPFPVKGADNAGRCSAEYS
jgi:hypothetical protein